MKTEQEIEEILSMQICNATDLNSFPMYLYSQNNSGGYDIENRDVACSVYIQGKDAAQANAIAENIGIYFDGVEAEIDCECCGDRWYMAFSGDDMQQDEFLSSLVYDVSRSYGKKQNPIAIVYLLNGFKYIIYGGCAIDVAKYSASHTNIALKRGLNTLDIFPQ